MAKHPRTLPDVVARELSDLAWEHGYSIEHLTLSWVTNDLGHPQVARVTYTTEIREFQTLDGSLEFTAL